MVYRTCGAQKTCKLVFYFGDFYFFFGLKIGAVVCSGCVVWCGVIVIMRQASSWMRFSSFACEEVLGLYHKVHSYSIHLFQMDF